MGRLVVMRTGEIRVAARRWCALAVAILSTSCGGVNQSVTVSSMSNGGSTVTLPKGLEPAPDEDSSTVEGSSVFGSSKTGTGSLTIDPQPDLTAPVVQGPAVDFPLSVNATGVVVDASGKPFQMVGDAAWSMLVQLDSDQTDHYLSVRRSQGFNTIVVNLIEHHFADDPPANAFGVEPFESPGDFSRPVNEYFDNAHAAIARAADQGFVVLVTPAYLGYDGGEEGWYQEMKAVGPDVLERYGEYVGERFRDLDNIIWVEAGDFVPPTDDLDLVEAVRTGLVRAGADQLETAHWSRQVSGTDVGLDWLDVNTTYTAAPVYPQGIQDDENSELPHFLVESDYEEVDQADEMPQMLRSQWYEAVLTGGFGSIFGNDLVWAYVDGWEEALYSPGSVDMEHAGALLQSVPWTALEPDVTSNRILTDPGSFGSPNMTVVAASADLRDLVAYVPASRDLVFEIGNTRGKMQVKWYDPTAGEFHAADARSTGTQVEVAQPGNNATGDSDWVLVWHIDP